MSDRNFRKGHFKFNKPSDNPNASIVNDGSITTSSGGTVILSGSTVVNDGVIEADLGNVVLAGDSAFSVDFQGDNLIRFQITAPVSKTPVGADGKPTPALVSNTGTISAKGGKVLLTANAARGVVDNVINSSGIIEATSASSQNGEVVLAGDYRTTVNVSGTVDASGKAAGETGGTVTVTGGTVNVADGTKIDASGDAGGGTINIGGGAHGQGPIAHAQNVNVGNATINADAIDSGNGGNVVLWSDGTTTFNGSISAKGGANGGNGGFVETSGHNLGVGLTARVNTLAANGSTGNWLLDPDNINVQTGGSAGVGCSTSLCTIDPITIECALGYNCSGGTNVTLEANVDINVYNDVIYSSANTLSLLAGSDINVYANIENTLATGGGNINLIAGWDKTTTDFGLPDQSGRLRQQFRLCTHRRRCRRAMSLWAVRAASQRSQRTI